MKSARCETLVSRSWLYIMIEEHQGRLPLHWCSLCEAGHLLSGSANKLGYSVLLSVSLEMCSQNGNYIIIHQYRLKEVTSRISMLM